MLEVWPALSPLPFTSVFPSPAVSLSRGEPHTPHLGCPDMNSGQGLLGWPPTLAQCSLQALGLVHCKAVTVHTVPPGFRLDRHVWLGSMCGLRFLAAHAAQCLHTWQVSFLDKSRMKVWLGQPGAVQGRRVGVLCLHPTSDSLTFQERLQRLL